MSSLGAANSVRNGFDLANSDLLAEKKLTRERNVNNKKFFIAISESDIDQVNSLLKKVDINYKDQDGCTPLHWAVETSETGDLSIIKILIKSGADLHIVNSDHETPLDIAKKLNRLDIVDILENPLDSTNKPKVTVIKNDSESKRKLSSQEQEIVWINPVHGYIYQLKVLMLFLHRGLSCKYSFRLGTEIKEAKKFDDLVFEYIEGRKKVYRLLQAKHKYDESKKITVDKLLTETRGDYSLVKYFYSFQACKNDNFFKDGIIKDVIICTNIDFDMDDLKNAGIKLNKVEEKDNILDIKSNEKEPARYKFANGMIKLLKSRLKAEESENDIKYFLKHLVFAVNQPNEEELGQIIKKEIGKEIGLLDTENAYNTLLIKMMDLSLGKRNSMYLSHEDGKKFFDDLKKDIPIWFNIQDPIASFTGRTKYLKQMHKNVKKSYVCISGMGGVGKTELVRKYIAIHGHEYKNQVVWINAESYRSAVDSFRQLASDKLNISLQTSDGQEKHIMSVITEVYQFFSKENSLFIFDNAEKYKSKDESDYGIDRFLPCLPDNCVKPNIIVTSRYQKWPTSVKLILLETFNVEEARALVEKSLALESDEQKEMVDELGKKLQFLPLALQQAVAYIKMQKEKLACIDSNFEISNYLEKYSDMTQELLDFEFSEDSDSSYNRSVFTTWNITLDALKQKENGSDALDILNIMSYFLPDNIPIQLLLVFSSDKEKLSSAIGLLKQYSIVSVQHKAVSVHRLVQQVTRIKLQKQNDEVNVLEKALKLLDQDNINFTYIDHVLSMWSFARNHSQLLGEYARLATAIVYNVRECGRNEEALSIGNEVIELLRAPSENDKELLYHLLSIRNNIAMCIQQKGDYKIALEEYQQIYKLQKTILEPAHPKVLASKNNISYALMQMGRNKEALESFYELLDGYRVNLEEYHPNILLAKSTISSILSQEGEDEEALSIMQEVYEMQEKVPSIFLDKIFIMRCNMAEILCRKNKLEDPMKAFEDIICDQEKIHPPNHPNILAVKTKIARLLASQGNPSAALDIFREILDIEIERLGENHPDAIFTNVNIAICLKMQDQHGETMNILKVALDKLQITLGPVHQYTLLTQAQIADVLYTQKKYSEAIEIYEDILSKQISVSGDNRPKTLETRRLMMRVLYEQEKYDALLKLGLEVLHNAETVHGKNHSETLLDKQNVGNLYFQVGDFEKSSAILKELLEVQESLLGKDHVDCQTTRDSIALALDSIGQRNLQERFKQDIEEGSKFMCYQVTENGTPKRFDINERGLEYGNTVLHGALLNTDDAAVIDALIENGAEIFVKNDEGETPLHIAASRGIEDFIMVLLCRLKPECLNDFINAKTTSTGSTALHIAAEKGHYQVVQCLLMSQATFCVKDKNGKTPMNVSTDSKISKLLKMVLELFKDMKKSDAAGVLRKLKKLSDEQVVAAIHARDDQGSNLMDMAKLKNQNKVTSHIRQVLYRMMPKD